METKLIVIAWLFFFHAAFGQDNVSEWMKELEQASKVLKKENQLISYDKLIFKNGTDQSPSSSENGVVMNGVNGAYKLKESGNTIVQQQGVKIQVDSTNATIVVYKADPLNPTFSMDGFLEEYKNGNVLVTKQTTALGFRYELQFNGHQSIDKVTFLVNKKGTLVQNEIWYKPDNYYQDNLEDETVETPVLRIQINTVKPTVFSAATFAFSTYFENIDLLALTPAFANYEVMDLRIPTK